MMNSAKDLLIKNVNVVTMLDRNILEKRNILIRDGVIAAVNMQNEQPDINTAVIDAQGKYIMPGLINMHVHLGDNKDDLLLYLLNGVTSIRNMWGYGSFRLRQWLMGTRVFEHLKLKKQIEERKIEGPRIFTAGPMLDGDPPFFPPFMPVHSIGFPTDAELIIKKQAVQGYDFVKIYSGLSREAFDGIMESAKRWNMPVAGHVPDAVGLKHALKSKVCSVEHLYGFFNPYYPQMNIEKQDIKELSVLAAKNGVWNCPTLIANARIANMEMQKIFEDEKQMDYISSRNKNAMRFLLKASARLFRKKGLKPNHEYMDFLYEIIQELHREGAGILLGTDKAVPYVVAGFSEHMEMRLLSNAGLSNYEVIKTATVNAAKCLNRQNELGTVEVGKTADLILLNENPLDDLGTISQHEGVFKGGNYYPRKKCDEMLRQIKNRL